MNKAAGVGEMEDWGKNDQIARETRGGKWSRAIGVSDRLPAEPLSRPCLVTLGPFFFFPVVPPPFQVRPLRIEHGAFLRTHRLARFLMKVRGGSSTEIYSTPKGDDLYPLLPFILFFFFFFITVLYGAKKIESYQDICQERIAPTESIGKRLKFHSTAVLRR